MASFIAVVTANGEIVPQPSGIALAGGNFVVMGGSVATGEFVLQAPIDQAFVLQITTADGTMVLVQPEQ